MPDTILRGGAVADGRASSVVRDVSLVIRSGKIYYLGPRSEEPTSDDASVVDAAGATIVPALVDCHAHFTGPGGAHWLARFEDSEAELMARAPVAARALARMGILTARDVGAPRALNLRVRDELRGQHGTPVIVAAGSWIARKDKYVSFAVTVNSGDELRRAALQQLDAGADLVKVAVDGPLGRGDEATFSVQELTLAVDAVHARGKKVAAHSLGVGARVAAEAGVDSIEHGFGIDRSTAVVMRGRTALVATLSVPASILTFCDTVGQDFDAERRKREVARLEAASDGVRAAHAAGVRIAAGSDFGGGSSRPGHLAWEVELLVRAGLQPHEALAAATWVGGEVVGIPHAGTLTVGGPADLFLVHGDPLSDPAALWRVWMVFQRGELVT